MAADQPLITINDVREIRYLNKNYDQTEFDSYVREIQRNYLEPLLGYDLYADLMENLTDQNYLDLLNGALYSHNPNLIGDSTFEIDHNVIILTEFFTNNANGWTFNNTEIAAGKLSATGGLGTANLDMSTVENAILEALVPGYDYWISFTIDANVGGIAINLGGQGGVVHNGTGAVSEVITMGTANSDLQFTFATSGSIDVLKVYRVSDLSPWVYLRNYLWRTEDNEAELLTSLDTEGTLNQYTSGDANKKYQAMYEFRTGAFTGEEVEINFGVGNSTFPFLSETQQLIYLLKSGIIETIADFTNIEIEVFAESPIFIKNVTLRSMENSIRFQGIKKYLAYLFLYLHVKEGDINYTGSGTKQYDAENSSPAKNNLQRDVISQHFKNAKRIGDSVLDYLTYNSIYYPFYNSVQPNEAVNERLQFKVHGKNFKRGDVIL